MWYPYALPWASGSLFSVELSKAELSLAFVINGGRGYRYCQALPCSDWRLGSIALTSLFLEPLVLMTQVTCIQHFGCSYLGGIVIFNSLCLFRFKAEN